MRKLANALVFIVDPVEIFVTCSLITMQNLVAVLSYCVHACMHEVTKMGT